MKERSVESRWQGILNALRNTTPDPSHPTFSNLAAGPLEDLLAQHGAEVIDRVVLEARRSPAFNLLLGGVWQNQMTDEVWSKVQKARLKSW